MKKKNKIPAQQWLSLLPGLMLGRCNPRTESLLLHDSPAHNNQNPYAQASATSICKYVKMLPNIKQCTVVDLVQSTLKSSLDCDGHSTNYYQVLKLHKRYI